MLTQKQKKTLEYIQSYYHKHGLYPSLEEIKKFLGLSSVSTAHYHVKSLQELGYLKRVDNRPRGLDFWGSEELVGVPVVGAIAAGSPIEAFEEREETVAIPKSRLPRSGEIFALKVTGQSMVNENIFDGDIVIVRGQPNAENGEKVVALIDGNSATLKTLYKEKAQIRLQPANSSMPPMLYDADRVEIQGKVVAVVRTTK